MRHYNAAKNKRKDAGLSTANILPGPVKTVPPADDPGMSRFLRLSGLILAIICCVSCMVISLLTERDTLDKALQRVDLETEIKQYLQTKGCPPQVDEGFTRDIMAILMKRK